MRLKHVVAALGVAFLVTACAQGQGPGTKQTIGGLGGAALGGLLGSQFGSGAGKLAATAAGTLGGALVGSEIGRYMDDADHQQINQAQRQAAVAPIGQPIVWNNPNSGNRGAVTPTRDGVSSSGQYCREFQQTVVVGGQTQEAFGVACQQADGTWRVVR